jgi:hypothetical protein
MVSHLFFYQRTLIALIWLCVMLHWTWPSDPATCPMTPAPTPPVPKRKRKRQPFVGLTTKPPCDACAHASDPRPEAPSPPPPRIVPTRGRRRQVDTSTHFCPNPDCAYHGWVSSGNLRANGHPRGGPWRQLLCVVCRGCFFETLGTLFHGKRAPVDLILDNAVRRVGRGLASLQAWLPLCSLCKGFMGRLWMRTGESSCSYTTRG